MMTQLFKSTVHKGCRRQIGAVRRGSHRSAFTVIELLVVMVILMIIVTVFARFFQRSTQSWESGMRTVETAISGRSALNLLIRDIERAVADPVLTNVIFNDGFPAFSIEPGAGAGIQFIVMSMRSPYRVQRLRYTLSEGNLIRDIMDVGSADWNPTPVTVIDNVVSIEFVPGVDLDDELPEFIGIRLRLSNRYNPDSSHDQEFVGRVYPIHRQRYPEL